MHLWEDTGSDERKQAMVSEGVRSMAEKLMDVKFALKPHVCSHVLRLLNLLQKFATKKVKSS